MGAKRISLSAAQMMELGNFERLLKTPSSHWIFSTKDSWFRLAGGEDLKEKNRASDMNLCFSGIMDPG